MNLHALAHQINTPPEGETILIYGKAKVGKSTLAATIAKVPRITHIDWFDNENSTARLKNLVLTGFLTKEEAEKIRIFSIRDSVELPLAFESLQKLVGLKRPINFCNAHGRDMALCAECKKDAPQEYQTFDMKDHNANTAIVIDSGSQYSDSIMHAYTKGEMEKGTSGLDNYRLQGLRLTEFLTEVQRGKTNWVVITHELAVEFEAGTERIAPLDYKGPKTEKYYPMIGTKPFSTKVGKYFGHVAHLEVSLRQHKGGSSTTYKADVITGSRTDWHIEKQLDANKKPIMSLVPLFK